MLLDSFSPILSSVITGKCLAVPLEIGRCSTYQELILLLLLCVEVEGDEMGGQLPVVQLVLGIQDQEDQVKPGNNNSTRWSG